MIKQYFLSLFGIRSHLAVTQQELDRSRVLLLEWQSTEEMAKAQVTMYRSRIGRLEAYIAAENVKRKEQAETDTANYEKDRLTT